MSNADFWKRWEIMAILFIVVVALVVGGGYAAYGVLSTSQDPAGSGLTVQSGDTIEVNYIGMFEDGTVFDTNIQSVAGNNTMYPKSLSFSYHPPYYPMSFKVGEGQMIQGFDNGVIGMGINQTKVVTIPVDEAYGESNPALIQERALVETFPVFEWISNFTLFQETYGIEPVVGTSVVSEYGWMMNVYFLDPNNDQIMVKHEPVIGEVVSLSDSWDSKVISVDASANEGTGEIRVQHLISSGDAGQISGSDSMGTFIVTGVDSNAGTFTVDYNREVVGKTLVFKITVVSITKP